MLMLCGVMFQNYGPSDTPLKKTLKKAGLSKMKLPDIPTDDAPMSDSGLKLKLYRCTE